MKFVEISCRMSLIVLASACLLAAPALAMPMDNPGRFEHGSGMFALIDNLTEEEMGNMTLGELKEMRQQAWNNTTASLAKEKGQDWGLRGCKADAKGMDKNGAGMRGNQIRGGPMDSECRHDGAFSGDSVRCDGAPMGMRGATPILLLMDDLTVEDLGNMTLNQIKDLSEKKMQELDNLTLNQIKQLQEEKALKRDNMTLSELKEQSKGMQQMAWILGMADIGHHFRN